MFVVCKVQDFEFEPSPKNRSAFPVEIKVDKGKMVGYLPVYETKEDALADYPDAKLMEIRRSSNEQNIKKHCDSYGMEWRCNNSGYLGKKYPLVGDI